MDTYEFQLKFKLPDTSNNPEELVEQHAEAGCDDALIGIGQKGRIALNLIEKPLQHRKQSVVLLRM